METEDKVIIINLSSLTAAACAEIIAVIVCLLNDWNACGVALAVIALVSIVVDCFHTYKVNGEGNG